MYGNKSVYPKRESGFALKPHMNNVYVEAFIYQSFNKEDNQSAILKI